jgi:uncharacterized protein (DUF58 family)
MAYDPAELRLPPWLLSLLNALIRLRLPVARNWRAGLTRPGILMMTAMLGVWAAATYSGNNLLYLCGAMLTSVTVAAIAQAVLLLKAFPDPGDALPILQAGETCVLRRKFTLNQSMAAAVELSWRNDSGSFRLLARCSAADSLLQGRLQPQRRGLFACRRLRLCTSAPLGLFIVEVIRDNGGDMAVLPAPLPWSAASAREGGGQRHRQCLREGDEWRDLRRYVSGDPLSRIHWRKATGDAGAWTVKRFSAAEALEPQALLRVDLRLPPDKTGAEFEQLLGRAWFWVKGRQRRGAQLLLGQTVFDLSDKRQYGQALKALAGASPETGPVAGSGGQLLSLAGQP